jgi:VIT1/CCC1 family predicted Fe2+/Mn2+ transporter
MVLLSERLIHAILLGLNHKIMIKISSIFILGIVIALIPFSGFPKSTKDLIYIIAGLAVAALSYLIRRELHEVLRSLHNSDLKNDTFTQNSPDQKSTENK